MAQEEGTTTPAVVSLFHGLQDEAQVKVICLKMNAQGLVLDCEVVGLGTDAASIIQPRIIVRGVLGALADSIILLLNHPQGSAQPTPAELDAYTTIVDLGKTLGFQVLDLVIVSKDDWFSFRTSQDGR